MAIFNVLPQPKLAGDTVFCSGEKAVLHALSVPADYKIQWFSVSNGLLAGATSDSLAIGTAGRYFFKAIGKCGNAYSDTLKVKSSLVILPFVEYANDTLRAISGYLEYQWSLNGSAIPGANKPLWAPIQSGFYVCTIKTAAGCTYSDGIQVIINSASTPKSILHLNLLPNPTGGNVQLQLDLDKIHHVSCWLTDNNEQQIFFQTVQLQYWSKTLELDGLPAGVYFLHLDIEGENLVRKIIKH